MPFISKTLRYGPCVTRGSDNLPATHTRTILPLLPSRNASPPFGWYSLRRPTKEWPGTREFNIVIYPVVHAHSAWPSLSTTLPFSPLRLPRCFQSSLSSVVAE